MALDEDSQVALEPELTPSGDTKDQMEDTVSSTGEPGAPDGHSEGARTVFPPAADPAIYPPAEDIKADVKDEADVGGPASAESGFPRPISVPQPPGPGWIESVAAIVAIGAACFLLGALIKLAGGLAAFATLCQRYMIVRG